MADLEIVHEQADGYTQQGHSVSYTDGYIKIRKSFHLKALRTLKGAPLSVFIEIALSDEPPTVQTICADTGYGSHAVCEALDYLVAHFFIEELGRDGSRGSKCYRALSYTWSGSDRNAPPDADLPTASGSRIAKSAIRQKRDPRPQAPVGLSPSAIRRTRIAKRPVVVDGTDIQSSFPEREQQQTETRTENTAARAILRGAGIFGKPLDELAGVDTETAEMWAEWIKQPGPGIYRPQGIAVNALRDDPRATPPGHHAPEPKREPHFQGKFADEYIRTKEDKP